MNQQFPEKPERLESGELDVHSIFRTIQGEGPYVGEPAVFIRLAGCSLRCPLCDTDYTSGRRRLSVGNIMDIVGSHREGGLVVITGGEPFRQNITPLVEALLDKDSPYPGYFVQIETNGTLYLEGFPYQSVMTVCSPKAKVHPKLEEHIDSWKYVGKAGQLSPADGLPVQALGLGVSLARPADPESAVVYLQPVDEKDELQNKRNVDACVQSCLKFGYRLCLQIHKIVGLE